MNEIINNLTVTPIGIFAIFLGAAGYIIIAAYMSGKWIWLNQKLNSRTKKAKSLLKIGVTLCLISSIMLAFIIPFVSKDEDENLEMKNPYLGEWEIISSPIEELPTSSRIRFFISKKNKVRATIKSKYGKELGFLSWIEWNHHDYYKSEGKLSTNQGTKLDFISSLDKLANLIEVKCYSKEGAEIGFLKIKR